LKFEEAIHALFDFSVCSKTNVKGCFLKGRAGGNLGLKNKNKSDSDTQKRYEIVLSKIY